MDGGTRHGRKKQAVRSACVDTHVLFGPDQRDGSLELLGVWWGERRHSCRQVIGGRVQGTGVSTGTGMPQC